MSYMVMECHRAYAIVLDSEGRFLKVANLGYSVGQKTDFVIESGADENLDDTGAEAGKPGKKKQSTDLCSGGSRMSVPDDVWFVRIGAEIDRNHKH